MTDKEFKDAQMKLIMIAQTLNQIDLEEFIKVLIKQRSVFPSLDAEAKNKAEKNLITFENFAFSLAAAKMAYSRMFFDAPKDLPRQADASA